MEVCLHEVSGSLTLYCLEGSVLLGLAQSTSELSTGEWIYLDVGEEHSLIGVDNASLLHRPQKSLMTAWHGKNRSIEFKWLFKSLFMQ